jgi:hypothetical protein
MKFNIGEKVLALTNPADTSCQPRTKGKIYTVTGMIFCPLTGEQSINIDHNLGISNYVDCNCGNTHLVGLAHYTRSIHFARINESALDRALDNEDYELAILIRDNLIKL